MNEAKTRSGSPNHKLDTFWSDRAQGRAETDLLGASLGMPPVPGECASYRDALDSVEREISSPVLAATSVSTPFSFGVH
jgi:hypothetical protein